MGNKELFREILKIHRIGMGAGNRKKTEHPNFTQTWLYPYQWENDYFETISTLQKRFLDPLEDFIGENLQSWINQYKIDAMLHVDEFSNEFGEAIDEAERDAEETYVQKSAIVIAALTLLGMNISMFNQKQSQKFFSRILGMPWTPEELWVDEVVSVWSKTNYTLVKSLTAEGIKNMNTLVSEGIQFGRTYDEIMVDIKKGNKNITNARSRLIARDQVGKLNGMLSQRRMQEAGINLYIWTTAGDEKVRGNPNGTNPKAVPSHYLIDGKLCRWDNNKVYSLDGGKTWISRTGKMPKAIPGQEIQCRCVGIPYFDDIIGEIDKEINEELAA